MKGTLTNHKFLIGVAAGIALVYGFGMVTGRMAARKSA